MELPSSYISGIVSRIDTVMNCFGATRHVGFSGSSGYGFMLSQKIEYMVVSFDNAERNAKLSLRQTEILAKLNTIVGDICADCPEEYIPLLFMLYPI